MKSAMSRFFVCLAVLLTSAGVANADAIYDVSVDTHSLGSGSAAAFTLIPGGALVTNTATISGITFGGGSAGTGCPAAVQPCTQNATGDLTSSIVLDDTSGFSQFVENFSAGTALSFQLDLTTNAPTDPSLFPDLFGFTLLDSNGNPLPDADPFTGNYLSIQIDSANPTVTTQVSAVSLNAGEVPEPGSLVLLATGCLSMFSGIGRKLVRSRE
jgi:hypothetical protein